MLPLGVAPARGAVSANRQRFARMQGSHAIPIGKSSPGMQSQLLTCPTSCSTTVRLPPGDAPLYIQAAVSATTRAPWLTMQEPCLLRNAQVAHHSLHQCLNRPIVRKPGGFSLGSLHGWQPAKQRLDV
jgi:hypothetical protein